MWIHFFCTHPLALPHLIPSCLLSIHGKSSPLLEDGHLTSIIRSAPQSQKLKSGKGGSSHLVRLPFYVQVHLLYQILPSQEDQKGKGLSLFFPSFPSLAPSPGPRVSGLWKFFRLLQNLVVQQVPIKKELLLWLVSFPGGERR